MKVYLVRDFNGDYWDYKAVLSNKNEADALAKKYEQGSVEEMVLNEMKGAYKRTVYAYMNGLLNLAGGHCSYDGIYPPKATTDIEYDQPAYAHRVNGKVLFCARSLVSPAHAEKLAKQAVASLLKKEKREQAKSKTNKK